MTVSVVMCVRDGSAYLREALASASAQTVAPLEIVVVDDGSTDDSADIAAEAGARVIRRPAEGPAAARNVALAAAQGSLIAFLDADDRWPLDRLEVLLAALSAADSGVYGSQVTFGAGVTPVRERACILGTLVVRAEACRRIGPFDPAHGLGEVFDWLQRATHLGLVLTGVDAVVLERRVHDANMSRARSDEVKAGFLSAARAAVARHRQDDA